MDTPWCQASRSLPTVVCASAHGALIHAFHWLEQYRSSHHVAIYQPRPNADTSTNNAFSRNEEQEQMFSPAAQLHITRPSSELRSACRIERSLGLPHQAISGILRRGGQARRGIFTSASEEHLWAHTCPMPGEITRLAQAVADFPFTKR